jgi:hypothetical protein
MNINNGCSCKSLSETDPWGWHVSQHLWHIIKDHSLFKGPEGGEPFAGNSDVAIWVEDSRVGRKLKQKTISLEPDRGHVVYVKHLEPDHVMLCM